MNNFKKHLLFQNKETAQNIKFLDRIKKIFLIAFLSSFFLIGIVSIASQDNQISDGFFAAFMVFSLFYLIGSPIINIII